MLDYKNDWRRNSYYPKYLEYLLSSRGCGKADHFATLNKRVIFSTDFGLRFFYTDPSQILKSLTDFCVDFLFTQILADSNIYTDVEYFTQVLMLHNTTIR